MPGQSESTPIRRAVVGPPAVFRRDIQPIGGVRYTYRPAPTGGLEIGAELRGHCGGTGSEQLTAQRAQPESAGQTATMPSRPSVDTTISRKDRHPGGDNNSHGSPADTPPAESGDAVGSDGPRLPHGGPGIPAGRFDRRLMLGLPPQHGSAARTDDNQRRLTTATRG